MRVPAVYHLCGKGELQYVFVRLIALVPLADVLLIVFRDWPDSRNAAYAFMLLISLLFAKFCLRSGREIVVRNLWDKERAAEHKTFSVLALAVEDSGCSAAVVRVGDDAFLCLVLDKDLTNRLRMTRNPSLDLVKHGEQWYLPRKDVFPDGVEQEVFLT